MRSFFFSRGQSIIGLSPSSPLMCWIDSLPFAFSGLSLLLFPFKTEEEDQNASRVSVCVCIPQLTKMEFAIHTHKEDPEKQRQLIPTIAQHSSGGDSVASRIHQYSYFLGKKVLDFRERRQQLSHRLLFLRVRPRRARRRRR